MENNQAFTLNEATKKKIIQSFYDILINTVKVYGYNSIKPVFTKKDTKIITEEEFINGLIKLGYHEGTQIEMEFLKSRYFNKLTPGCINLDIVENECNEYFQDKNGGGKPESNRPNFTSQRQGNFKVPVVDNIQEKVSFPVNPSVNFGNSQNLNKPESGMMFTNLQATSNLNESKPTSGNMMFGSSLTESKHPMMFTNLQATSNLTESKPPGGNTMFTNLHATSNLTESKPPGGNTMFTNLQATSNLTESKPPGGNMMFSNLQVNTNLAEVKAAPGNSWGNVGVNSPHEVKSSRIGFGQIGQNNNIVNEPESVSPKAKGKGIKFSNIGGESPGKEYKGKKQFVMENIEATETANIGEYNQYTSERGMQGKVQFADVEPNKLKKGYGFGNIRKSNDDKVEISHSPTFDDAIPKKQRISFTNIQQNDNSNINTHMNTNSPPNSGSNRQFQVASAVPKNTLASAVDEDKLIAAKLEKLDQAILEELKDNHGYIKATLYQNFSNFFKVKGKEMLAGFKKMDRFATEFIKPQEFEDYLDNCVMILSDEHKKILLMDITRNSGGDYSYTDFIDKIKEFREEDLINTMKQYHLNYNEYIVYIRKYFKDNNCDLRKAWAEFLNGALKADMKGFGNFLKNMGVKLHQRELEYVFSKFSLDDKYVEFKTFENVIKRDPPSRESLKRSERELTDGKSGHSQSASNRESMSFGGTLEKKNMNKNILQNIQSIENTKNAKDIKGSSNQHFNFDKLDNIAPTSNMYINNNSVLSGIGGNPFSQTQIVTRSSVRDHKYFNELKNLDEKKKHVIILERLTTVDENVAAILAKHQSYSVLKIYEYLATVFRPMGNLPYGYFKQREREKVYHVSAYDFNGVLQQLGINFTQEQLKLIFMSIKTKTDTLFSYEEFLRRIFSFQNEFLIKNNIERTAHYLFNDYLCDFRYFFQEKNLDPIVKWEECFGKVQAITADQFSIFVKKIDYELSHIDEYKFLFNRLSENGTLSVRGLLDFTNIKDMTEEEFLDSGSLTKEKEMKKTGWKTKLNSYTSDSSELYKKNYGHLFNMFQEINKACKKKEINDIIDYFDRTNQINDDGEINEMVFANLLGNMGVMKGLDFQSLIGRFQNTKTKLVNIAMFLNIYFAFYPDENKLEGKSVKKGDAPLSPGRKKNIKEGVQGKDGNEKVVFTNHKRGFTKEDFEQIQDLVDFIVDIIFNEKNIGVKDYFTKKDAKKNSYFTLSEFIKILKNDLLVDTDNGADQLTILYDFLAEDNRQYNLKDKEEFIKLERLLNVFEKYAKEGIELKKSTKTDSRQNTNTTPGVNIPAERKIIEDFAHYIDNNRIKFKTIFPSLEDPKETVIHRYELKNAFQIAKYPILNDDIELLVKYFDPHHKSTINVSALVSMIKEFTPGYFDKPFQVTDHEKIKKQGSLHALINSNPQALNAINQINSYLQENKLTIDEFFMTKFNKDKNETISKSEFLTGMCQISQKFVMQEMQDVFDILDKDSSKTISLAELYLYLENPILTKEERKEKVTIEVKILEEIHEIFDFFDLDKDNKISKADFLKAMKSLDHRATIQDVDAIMSKVDKDKNNIIDRKEFVEIMEGYLREQMVVHEEEREYILKLFKEADVDKVGFLTPNQLKYLLKEKLNSDFTDKELNEIINETDCNYDGMIDIEEFVKILDNVGSHDGLQNTVRQITLKRKIHPKMFLSIFSGLPMNFMPSFIRDEQKILRLLPSNALVPVTDQSGILFMDILPLTQTQTNKSIGKTKYSAIPDQAVLRPIQTAINAKISFDTATGVTSPSEEALKDQSIVGRVVKITFFNSEKNKFFGNAISIDATWKKEYQDKWYFEEDRLKFNNNIIVRYNGNDCEQVQIIFEFVIIIKKDNFITETSCGWSSCLIKDLLTPAEKKLSIKGGSPKKADMINPHDVRANRSGWGKLASFFQGPIKSQLPIKIKPFKELSNIDKQYIDYLPSCIITNRAAMHMIYVYRNLIGKQILNNQFYSLKVIKNQPLIINSFCKIADCPDAFRMMIEHWNEIVVEGATNDERKDDSYWENNFVDFVNRVYTVLYAEQFKYEDLDPTKTALGDINLMIARSNLINSAIRYDKGKKINKNNFGPVENISSFKPFSIYELIGRKINIISKLDEMILYSEKNPNEQKDASFDGGLR